MEGNTASVIFGIVVLIFSWCRLLFTAAKENNLQIIIYNMFSLPVAIEAVHLNASKNNIPVDTVTMSNLVGTAGQHHQVVLAGDLFYDTEFAGHVLTWLLEAHRR